MGQERTTKRLRRRATAIGCAMFLAQAANASATSPIGSWTLWASPANGVPFGVFPTLAYAPQTNTLFYSTRFPPSQSNTLGTVWSCDLGNPTPLFTKLPQTGLVLPTPKSGNSITNVFSMTTDASGEPIIGTGAPGNTDPTQTGQTKLYRFDKASNQWVAPPLTALAGQNLPVLQPNNIMYQLTRGADGTIWGGGQWGKTYRSTDGGINFTVFDEKLLVAQTDPAYYTTGGRSLNQGDGAIYGIRVAPNGYIYEGTEVAGVIYSPDNGTTWHPLDYDYTNPNSTMTRASDSGNIAGLGFTKDGKIVVQGAPSTAPFDATHLYLFDPVNHTEQICTGFSDYFFGSQDVHTIMTAPDGTMFINTGRNTVASGSPTPGGVFTSTDGLNWTPFNTGLTSVANADFRSAGPDSMVVIGNDVFMSTTDGKIWKYTTTPVTFNTTQQLASLSILSGDTVVVTGGSSGHRSVLFTPSLLIAGTLDLTSNDLDVQSSASLSTVTALLKQGFSSGNWNGGGISSSAAANDSAHLTALGVLQNIATGGSPLYTTFDGAAVVANDVLVKYTYYGDANLDGTVNGADYQQIDKGFGAHLTAWSNGDFNYDGVINGTDYALIDNTFNQIAATGAGPLALVSSSTNLIATPASASAVPEPASLGLFGIASLFIQRRRRR